RELEQIVGEQNTLTDRDGGMQPSNDGVKILDWRLEFEGRLMVGVEPPIEPGIRPEGVVREDHAIREAVGPTVPEQAFDNVECASELVWKHRNDARRIQRRHARTVATQLKEVSVNGDCTCEERHGSGVSERTSKRNPAAVSRSNIGPVCRLHGFDS